MSNEIEFYEVVDKIVKKWAKELEEREAEFGDWEFGGYDPLPGTIYLNHKSKNIQIYATPYYDGFAGIPIEVHHWGEEDKELASKLEERLENLEDVYPASSKEYWRMIEDAFEVKYLKELDDLE